MCFFQSLKRLKHIQIIPSGLMLGFQTTSTTTLELGRSLTDGVTWDALNPQKYWNLFWASKPAKDRIRKDIRVSQRHESVGILAHGVSVVLHLTMWLGDSASSSLAPHLLLQFAREAMAHKSEYVLVRNGNFPMVDYWRVNWHLIISHYASWYLIVYHDWIPVSCPMIISHCSTSLYIYIYIPLV
jgi:hypothetical protein